MYAVFQIFRVTQDKFDFLENIKLILDRFSQEEKLFPIHELIKKYQK